MTLEFCASVIKRERQRKETKDLKSETRYLGIRVKVVEDSQLTFKLSLMFIRFCA